MAVLTPTVLNTTEFQPGQVAGIGSSKIRDGVDSGAGVPLSPNSPITGSTYTLQLNDYGTRLLVNSATGVSITVPPNANVAFMVNAVIEIGQKGAGQVTLVQGAGVTLHPASSLTTRAQYSVLSIWQEVTDTWWVGGDAT